jgi:hypothetical protein
MAKIRSCGERYAEAAMTVGVVLTVAGLLILAGVLGLGVWAIRQQNRMFPKGFDRTGWKPEPGRARRFETMWTYFSGRGGGG